MHVFDGHYPFFLFFVFDGHGHVFGVDSSFVAIWQVGYYFIWRCRWGRGAAGVSIPLCHCLEDGRTEERQDNNNCNNNFDRWHVYFIFVGAKVLIFGRQFQYYWGL